MKIKWNGKGNDDGELKYYRQLKYLGHFKNLISINLYNKSEYNFPKNQSTTLIKNKPRGSHDKNLPL